jgi:hypothetical protein
VNQPLIPVERIEQSILVIRGCKIMLDVDLAAIYGVSTTRLNEQVRRNLDRFPPDFMFQLTPEEKAEVIANCDNLARLKYAPFPPYAFTEHGAVMLASVLNSQTAVQASVAIVRAFVRLREMMATHKDLARRLGDLERKCDKRFVAVFEAIRQLTNPPEPPSKGLIGFHQNKPADGQGVSEPEPGKEPSLGRRGRRRPKRALAAAGYR